ncbi:MAG: Holliday junction branch migration protein RuvA [Synergistaceae bacterium]|nr:Holliday junction branch migration protein RuvA [Synergistaceae bacterium]
MIRFLHGKVIDVLENVLILDVNGLGFEILCSRSVLTQCRRGEDVTIITSLQVSESGAVIYGFNSESEREFFTRLTGVKGVGGRSAIAILSELSLDEIINAVSSADVNAFTRVPGIGKKTAERLCFELKNIAALKVISGDSESSQQGQKSSGHAESVIDALISLGFTRSDSGQVINLLRAAHGEGFNSLGEEDLLRLALRELHDK